MKKITELERGELGPGAEELWQSGFGIHVLNPLPWEAVQPGGWTDLWHQVRIQSLSHASSVTLDWLLDLSGLTPLICKMKRRETTLQGVNETYEVFCTVPDTRHP